MKAQATIEFMLNISVWLTFLLLIISGLMIFSYEINSEIEINKKTELANTIAYRVEALQSTGFTVYCPVEKHKTVGSLIIIDDEKNAKMITADTIFGFDIYGQPQ